MTTTDPAVVFAVVFATGAGALLALLLLKLLIDAASDAEAVPAPARQPAVPAHCPPAPPAPLHRPHALITAPDETQPITTVQPNRARHRKGHRWT